MVTALPIGNGSALHPNRVLPSHDFEILNSTGYKKVALLFDKPVVRNRGEGVKAIIKRHINRGGVRTGGKNNTGKRALAF